MKGVFASIRCLVFIPFVQITFYGLSYSRIFIHHSFANMTFRPGFSRVRVGILLKFSPLLAVHGVESFSNELDVGER